MQLLKIHFVLIIIGIHALVGLLLYAFGTIDSAPSHQPSFEGKILYVVLNDHPYILPLITRTDNKNDRYFVSGRSIEDLAKNIGDLQQIERSRTIVLLIGKNEALNQQNLEFLINNLPDSIPLIWLSVPPVDNKVETKTNNAEINTFNQKIKQICAEKGNCSYVDLTNQLADQEGNLRTEFHIGDGINFNRRGSQVLNEIIHSLVSQSLFGN